MSEDSIATGESTLSRSSRELQQLCKSLENKLSTKTHELDLAHAKIAKLRCSKKDLKEKLRASNEELNKTRSMLEEVDFDFSQQVQENKDLRKKLTRVEKTSASLEKANEGLRSAIEASEMDVESKS